MGEMPLIDRQDIRLTGREFGGMNLLILFVAVGAVGTGNDSVMQASARLTDCSLRAGATCTIELDISFKEGFTGTGGGIPAPLLQIQVPQSARLKGEVLDTHDALKKNEFLQAPFERLIDATPATIEFKLTEAPEAGDAFYLNVIGYAAGDDAASTVFQRQRLKLPLQEDARGEQVDASKSDWGVTDVLQIGEPADAFVLPSADGKSVALLEFAGKKNVIVTTYRAFW